MHRPLCGLLTHATWWRGPLLLVGAALATGSCRPDRIDQGLPVKPTRTIEFTTDEGTWMSLDVAPDGKTIVFDLLGDLYMLPIAGGKATRLTHGIANDAAPRISPDGRRVAFISDRSGRTQIWTVGVNGSGARQLTHDPESMSAPAWSPDGRFLVAPRGDVVPHSSLRDVKFQSLWKYDAATGAGVVLDAAPGVGVLLMTEGRRTTGVAFHPDGKTIYYGEMPPIVLPTSPELWRRWRRPRFALKTFDVAKGWTAALSTPDSSAIHPLVSPDGPGWCTSPSKERRSRQCCASGT